MNNLNSEKLIIEKQLNDVKIKKREEYHQSKNNFQNNTAKENITTEKGQWPKNTTVVGDSIINGVLEKGLCGGGHSVKVTNFSDATVDDLNHHIIPLLQKKPSHIMVHAGINDAYHSTSREILNKPLNFKSFMQKLPDGEVYISTPTL